MTVNSFTIALCACICALSAGVAGQDYIAKGYQPPPLSGATTCQKNYVGNTPAKCPPSAGVPLTDKGEQGSTVCVSTTSGKSYEGVISLMYPATNINPAATGVPWCTSDSQCGSNPSVVCAAQGPTGSGNMCFPLAPSGCPFTGDTVNTTAGATSGRRLKH